MRVCGINLCCVLRVRASARVFCSVCMCASSLTAFLQHLLRGVDSAQAQAGAASRRHAEEGRPRARRPFWRPFFSVRFVHTGTHTHAHIPVLCPGRCCTCSPSVWSKTPRPDAKCFSKFKLCTWTTARCGLSLTQRFGFHFVLFSPVCLSVLVVDLSLPFSCVPAVVFQHKAYLSQIEALAARYKVRFLPSYKIDGSSF